MGFRVHFIDDSDPNLDPITEHFENPMMSPMDVGHDRVFGARLPGGGLLVATTPGGAGEAGEAGEAQSRLAAIQWISLHIVRSHNPRLATGIPVHAYKADKPSLKHYTLSITDQTTDYSIYDLQSESAPTPDQGIRFVLAHRGGPPVPGSTENLIDVLETRDVIVRRGV